METCQLMIFTFNIYHKYSPNFRAVTSKRFCRLLLIQVQTTLFCTCVWPTRNCLVLQQCNEAACELHGGNLNV